MSTLREISGRYATVVQMLEDDECDAEAVKDTLDGIEGELEDKLENIATVITELEADDNCVEQEIQRLLKLKYRYERNIRALKEYTMNHLIALGITRQKTPLHTFTVAGNGGKVPVIITETEPEELPPEFQKIEYDFDRDKIRKALEEGQELPFAHLGERQSHLLIR